MLARVVFGCANVHTYTHRIRHSVHDIIRSQASRDDRFKEHRFCTTTSAYNFTEITALQHKDQLHTRPANVHLRLNITSTICRRYTHRTGQTHSPYSIRQEQTTETSAGNRKLRTATEVSRNDRPKDLNICAARNKHILAISYYPCHGHQRIYKGQCIIITKSL